MYYAFWFDEEGKPFSFHSENLSDICDAVGGEEEAKAIFRKQYQPEMSYGAIIICGNELIWNFDAPPVPYVEEDFTPDFEDEDSEDKPE